MNGAWRNPCLFYRGKILSIQQRHPIVLINQILSSFSFKWLVGIVALTLGAAAHATQIIVSYDSGLYHIQEIKWLSEFGLVPGLAHVHSRFGYPSSWFSLVAPFNFGILEGRMASLTGGFVLLMSLITFVVATARLNYSRVRLDDLFLFVSFLLLVTIPLVWGLSNSPSPDPPVFVLGVIVAWLFIVISNIQNDKTNDDKLLQIRLLPLVLSVGAVSIKLNAIPLLALSMIFYMDINASFKKVVLLGGLISFLLIPFAAAGIKTSGFPFFPLTLFHFDVPWSLGVDKAILESKIIREWNRWDAPTPVGATDFNWIIPWALNKKVSALFVVSALTSSVRNQSVVYSFWP